MVGCVLCSGGGVLHKFGSRFNLKRNFQIWSQTKSWNSALLPAVEVSDVFEPTLKMA